MSPEELDAYRQKFSDLGWTSAPPVTTVPTQEISGRPVMQIPTTEIAGPTQAGPVLKLPTQEISGRPGGPPQGAQGGLDALARVNRSQAPSEFQEQQRSPAELERPGLPPAGPPTPTAAETASDALHAFESSSDPNDTSALAAAGFHPHPMSDEKATKQARHAMGLDAVKPETQAALDKAEGGVRAGMQENSAAAQAGYAQASGILDAAASHHETSRFNQMMADQVHQDEVAKQQTEIQQAYKELPEYHEDPSRYWRQQDTSARVAHGIAFMLGGLGQAFAGIKNPVQSMHEAARDDIADQRHAYERAREHGIDRIHGAESIYGQLRQKGFDDQRASLMAENHYLDGMQAQLGAAAAKTQGAQEGGKIQTALAQLDAMKAQNDKSLEQLVGSNASMIAQRYLAAQYPAPGVGAVGQDRIVKMPDGSVRVVPTDIEGRDARKKVGVTQNIQQNVDRALAIRKGASKADLLNPYSAVHMQLESLAAETSQLVTVARDQGAMSREDQSVANRAIGSMTGVMGNNDAVLKSTRDRYGEQLETTVKAMGGERVEQGYTYDARGRLAPKASYVGRSEKPASKMPSGFKPAVR